jgi:hypothetical protein
MIRKSILVLFALLVASATSGCAQYRWQKYGSTQDEFNKDAYECQNEAARTYPPHMVTQQITAGYTSPSTTNCYGNGSAYGSYGNVYGNSNVNCTTTPGQYHPGVTSTTDANRYNREQTFKQCMYARGYEYVKVE